MLFRSTLAAAAMLSAANAAPAKRSQAPIGSSQILANTTYGPIPGESSIFSNYSGVAAPFPAMYTAPILPTTEGPAAEDDLLWQNLLAAEWVIYSFYQTAVEMFNETDFTELGWLNTTYDRIMQIRDAEAGHLRIFQDQISSNSVKPGSCEYAFDFSDPTTFLAEATLIELSSMAFLTGLAGQAQMNSSKGALVAVAETEARHNTWQLIEIWNVNPFTGPSDTAYPYPNQILDTTHGFFVPGSCPTANPEFPFPDQNLPSFSAGYGTLSLTPGSHVYYNFSDPTNQPSFVDGQDYYAVFFHGLQNITMPFNLADNSSTIPAEFETLGIVIAVIATEPGAPTEESVIAGPGVILEQPTELGLALAGSA